MCVYGISGHVVSKYSEPGKEFLSRIPKMISKYEEPYLLYIDYIDNRLCYHLYLKYKGVIHEVYRENVYGNNQIAYNIWRFTRIGGWRPYKDTWFKKDNDIIRAFDRYPHRNSPGVYIVRHFYNRNQLAKALPALKYVWPKDDYGHTDQSRLFEFIQTLHAHPEMEFVYKNEKIKHLWSEGRLYKLSKEKRKKFLDYVNNAKRMWANSFNEIMYCTEHPKATRKEYERYLELNYFKTNISAKINPAYVIKRYSKQIERHGKGHFCHLYKEYIKAAKKLGIKQLYPRNIETAHDTLTARVEISKPSKRIISKKLYKKYISLIKTIKPNKNYAIVIPEKQSHLVALGNILHNCVGHMSYGEDMLEGKCLIVQVNRNNKPYACCELKPTNKSKSFKIEQLYGDHNSVLKTKEPRLLVNRFIRSYAGARA